MALIQGSHFWKKRFPGDETKFCLITRQRAHVHLARWEIMVEAVNTVNADYLLWIDDDAVPPADTLERLFKHDKDMVVPVFTSRTIPVYYPYSHIVDTTSTGPKMRKINSEDIKEIPPCLTKIGTAGFHTLLMKRKVVDAVLVETKGRSPFTSVSASGFNEVEQKSMGEDAVFCYVAYAAGQELWLDPTFEVGHVGSYVFGSKDVPCSQK